MLVDSTKESLRGQGPVDVFSDVGVEMQEATETELVEAPIESCEIREIGV
jgi:hypothetical protein